MSREDISENFGESHHYKNLNIESFGESKLKIVNSGLIEVQGSKRHAFCSLFLLRKKMWH